MRLIGNASFYFVLAYVNVWVFQHIYETSSLEERMHLISRTIVGGIIFAYGVWLANAVRAWGIKSGHVKERP